MARHKMVNGIKIDFTEAEEIKRDEEEAQAIIDRQARIDAETTEANKKASGKQKLKDLGLDDDEIKALMGA
jgi:hypothetical protein